MMKKLVVVLMAAFFSFSVAGLSFADEPTPAANPCAGKAEMKKEEPKKATKKAKKKKAAAAKKEEAPAAAPAAPAAPAEKK